MVKIEHHSRDKNPPIINRLALSSLFIVASTPAPSMCHFSYLASVDRSFEIDLLLIHFLKIIVAFQLQWVISFRLWLILIG